MARVLNDRTGKPMKKVSDLNVASNIPLPAPALMLHELPRSEAQEEVVAQSRQDIHNIIFHDDPRLLLIVGPCSIHDVKAGLEYATRLRELSDRVGDRVFLVMRCYFEKPRTTVGWKGLIMDPQLDGSDEITEGLRIARRFLQDVIELGVPTATELLDPITPQYIADLICWSAVGARTTESQTHRQMASGLSMPLGFKNATSGAIEPAVNAIKAAGQPQTFFGISGDGVASAVSTTGNTNCHLILRGGDSGPNYSAEHVAEAERQLERAGLDKALVIDCSHGNSGKDATRQPYVLRSVVSQRAQGTTSIVGSMLESNLEAGNQPFPQPLDQLQYGKSITDACVDWQTTEEVVLEAARRLSQSG
jgi:3-deoxy-7-phosphoheptulonate synthase